MSLLLKPWQPEDEGAFFEFMSRQCHICKQHKKGGGKIALGQHLCKLLWGGLMGTTANVYSRVAWVFDEKMGKSICRQCQLKPAPKPRRRKPDCAAQRTMEL